VSAIKVLTISHLGSAWNLSRKGTLAFSGVFPDYDSIFITILDFL